MIIIEKNKLFKIIIFLVLLITFFISKNIFGVIPQSSAINAIYQARTPEKFCKD